MRDADLMAKTPGVYAVNIGDTTDNWGGRLIRLYAENDVSRQTERKLARWFLQESGIRWLVWLHGNHDTMDGAFTSYLEGINGHAGGGTQRQEMHVQALTKLIRDAGRVPVERDTLYRPIVR